MMNKIVRDNYPVEKLPDDLRVGISPGSTVRITIEGRDSQHDQKRRLQELLNTARDLEPASDDPVDRIRKLRDEWDR